MVWGWSVIQFEQPITAICHFMLYNPSYLASVYRHIGWGEQSLNAVALRAVALRAVASEPTRIEAYDQEGKLLFVDFEGNGSFADSGDLVASEGIYDLYPVLPFDANELQMEFRYHPLDKDSMAIFRRYTLFQHKG